MHSLLAPEDKVLCTLLIDLKIARLLLKWEKSLMGPIPDRLGVEQGGVFSDRQYNLANNEQHFVAQASSLDLVMGDIDVGSIGLADDTCDLSDCIFKLHNPLQLTIDYCRRPVKLSEPYWALSFRFKSFCEETSARNYLNFPTCKHFHRAVYSLHFDQFYQ
jgi:hypothetical protein